MSDDRFAGHPRLGGHDAAAGHDTHGLPWEGRRVDAARFAGDDGGADPAVRRLMTALAQAPATARAAVETELVALLSEGRVLVPIVAAPDADGTETESTMATALLRGPDGSSALPAFTGVDALADWEPGARPVPTPTREAARAALEDGCAAMVLDVADPHAAVLRGSMLWALALGESWVPAHEDPVVRLAVAEAAMGLDGLLGARAEDGSIHAPGTTRLVLTLRAGLPPASVEGIAARLGERLAAQPDVRRRIDDLAIVVHQASDPADAVPFGGAPFDGAPLDGGAAGDSSGEPGGDPLS